MPVFYCCAGCAELCDRLQPLVSLETMFDELCWLFESLDTVKVLRLGPMLLETAGADAFDPSLSINRAGGQDYIYM